jgi:hypothetical protein
MKLNLTPEGHWLNIGRQNADKNKYIIKRGDMGGAFNAC